VVARLTGKKAGQAPDICRHRPLGLAPGAAEDHALHPGPRPPHSPAGACLPLGPGPGRRTGRAFLRPGRRLRGALGRRPGGSAGHPGGGGGRWDGDLRRRGGGPLERHRAPRGWGAHFLLLSLGDRRRCRCNRVGGDHTRHVGGRSRSRGGAPLPAGGRHLRRSPALAGLPAGASGGRRPPPAGALALSFLACAAASWEAPSTRPTSPT